MEQITLTKEKLKDLVRAVYVLASIETDNHLSSTSSEDFPLNSKATQCVNNIVNDLIK